jgi:hypothetical protein
MQNPFGSLARELFGSVPERRLALLTALWPKVVGPEVARRTQVVALEGERLRVRLPPGPWRRTIGPMRAEILLRLRASAGPLAPRTLVFVEGRFAPDAEVPTRTRPLPEAEVPLSVDAASRVIDDPEIRESYRNVAARYLARTARPRPDGTS